MKNKYPSFAKFFKDVIGQIGNALQKTDKLIDLQVCTMPFDDSENIRENTLNKLAFLVHKYGHKNTLYVFEFCSQTGCELQGSTIDEIQYSPIGNDFLIMFNANTKDYAMIDDCSTEELFHFVIQLENWLKENKD